MDKKLNREKRKGKGKDNIKIKERKIENLERPTGPGANVSAPGEMGDTGVPRHDAPERTSGA